jgi:hypothetical protein
MVAQDTDIVLASEVEMASGDEFIELASRGKKLVGHRVGGHTAVTVQVGHSQNIGTESLQTAYATERSLLRSQHNKGRGAQGSAATVEAMLRVTEQALGETEIAIVLGSRQAALKRKEELAVSVRDCAKRLAALATAQAKDSGDAGAIAKLGDYVGFVTAAGELGAVAEEAGAILNRLRIDTNTSAAAAMDGIVVGLAGAAAAAAELRLDEHRAEVRVQGKGYMRHDSCRPRSRRWAQLLGTCPPEPSSPSL